MPSASARAARYAKGARRGLLAKVHMAAKALGMTKGEYCEMLMGLYGVSSAADLSDAQLGHLVGHFHKLGWTGDTRRAGDKHGKPKQAAGRKAQLEKIEALLAEKGRRQGSYVPWDYAAAILKKQCGVERLDWATSEQLAAVIVALSRDLARS